MKNLKLHVSHLGIQAPELCYFSVRGVKLKTGNNGIRFDPLDFYHALKSDLHPTAYGRKKLFSQRNFGGSRTSPNTPSFVKRVSVTKTHGIPQFSWLDKTYGGFFTGTKQILELIGKVHDKGGKLLPSEDHPYTELPPSKEIVTFLHVSKFKESTVAKYGKKEII